MALRFSYLLVCLMLVVLPAKLLMSYYQYSHTKVLTSETSESEEENQEKETEEKKPVYLAIEHKAYWSFVQDLKVSPHHRFYITVFSIPYFRVPTPPPQLFV